jgi:hypothetical protein
MLQPSLQEVPEGMLFRDIRVAGVHPYRGGKLSLTVVLHQVPLKDGADQVLTVAEGAAGAIDFGTALLPYLKVARAVLGGVTSLLNLGAAPVVGCRHEIDPDSGDDFRPGFYALLRDQVDPSTLWVRDGRLLAGPDAAGAAPVRSTDYVLYSVNQTAARSDVEALPFFAPLWNRVLHFANLPDDKSYETAKVNMATLSLELFQSPDLTRAHAEELVGRYADEMVAVHGTATQLAHRGPADLPADDVVARNLVSDVLALP